METEAIRTQIADLREFRSSCIADLMEVELAALEADNARMREALAVLVPVDVLQRIARDAESLADELTGHLAERAMCVCDSVCELIPIPERCPDCTNGEQWNGAELVECSTCKGAGFLPAALTGSPAGEFVTGRVAKLLKKGSPFIVIASHEPYYRAAYGMIRENERAQGTWSDDDEARYRAGVRGAPSGAFVNIPTLMLFRDTIQELLDVQNGCPLPKYQEAFDAANAQAIEIEEWLDTPLKANGC